MARIEMPHSPCLASAGTLFRDVFPWLLLLAAAVVVGGVVIAVLRRKMRPRDPGAQGFTLHALRQMHARGELTDEEFKQSRDSLIRCIRDTTPTGENGSDDPSTTGNAPDAHA